MIWYVFDMTGFAEPLHLSLTRAYMRALRRESPEDNSHLYAAYMDHEVTPATYYLCTADERAFTRLIRQFGGRKSAAPPRAQLQEVRNEGDYRSPAPEIDTAPC